MKKPYSAPLINLQSLSAGGLSTACAFNTPVAMTVCPVEIPEWDGETVFSDYGTCDWTPNDNVCYDVPTAASNIFES